MKRFTWADLDAGERRRALARPTQRTESNVRDTVRQIFSEIETGGADAVKRWSERLDGRAPEKLLLDGACVAQARAALGAEDLAALDFAADNIKRYHDADRPVDAVRLTANGVECKRVWRPLRTAGLYVPGGTAPLFSTLLMLAIPAACAGVRERVTVTPPSKTGVHPMMIAAGAAAGLDAIWIVGGAQAIAAMTYGAGLPRVEKLFGPGNAYVAEAKRYAAELPGGPAIDLPAGPSELLVIADTGADPAVVAADLLSQAEHDADAQVILVTTSNETAQAVELEVERQVATLPRETIARAALKEARVILVRDLNEAAEVSNRYAPEHLSLQLADAQEFCARIESAGTVFLGAWSAETFGDYVSGPSHVLPTDGAASAWSGVNVASFMTSFAIQAVSRDGARSLAPAAARLARLEGLEAHARAADIRNQ